MKLPEKRKEKSHRIQINLDGVELSGSRASYSPVYIRKCDNVHLNVNNCIFSDNIITRYTRYNYADGGAIDFSTLLDRGPSSNFILGTGTATISNSQFLRNSVNRQGGAIALFGVVAKIENCTIDENNAYSAGGGLKIGASRSGSYIANSKIRNNRCSGPGGGIYYMGYSSRYVEYAQKLVVRNDVVMSGNLENRRSTVRTNDISCYGISTSNGLMKYEFPSGIRTSYCYY